MAMYLVFSSSTSKFRIQLSTIGLRLLSNKIPTLRSVNSSTHLTTEEHKSKPLQNGALSKFSLLEPRKMSTSERTAENQVWKEYAKLDYSKLPHHYLMLSKFRLTSLVVLTSMASYALAPAPFELSTFLLVSCGTGLISCSANAVNQFCEVPFDSQMSRTKNRVLVRGLLTPVHALTFATVCAATGLTTLYFGANGLVAGLGALNLFLYTMVYTPLKRVTILNTWVGSVVGAIPPLMGWAAAMGSIGPGAWVMAGVLFAWQFPHFNALSWNLRPDYSKGGYRMMCVTDPSLCKKTSLRYTVALLGVSLMAPVLDVTDWLFALESTPLNAYFIYLAWKFYRESDSASSRNLFRFSLLHLPLLMLLLLINKKHWETAQSEVVKPRRQSSDIRIVLSTEPIAPTTLLDNPAANS